MQRFSLKLALLAMVSHAVAACALADTLATWTFPTPSKTTPVQNADPCASALASATVSAGAGVTLNSTAGYGGSSFHEANSRDDAIAAGNYFQIDFEVAANYSTAPSALAYTLSRSTTGPTNIAWMCSTDGGASFNQLEAFTFTKTTAQSFSLDVSSVGNLAAGSTVCLRLVAWNASAAGGTFYFKETATISGSAETVGEVEPSIGTILGQNAVVGELLTVPLTISGDTGASVTTNVVSATAVVGQYGLTNAVFHYVPAEADVAASPVSFTVTLAVDAKPPVTRTFSIEVSLPPDPPFESFDSATKAQYAAETFNHTDFSGWQGTNCVVGADPNDNVVGAKAVRFRAGSGYMEMTADKPRGAGTISLWLGIHKGDKQGEATVRVMLSKNGGSTWAAWASGDIDVTMTFREVVFPEVNVSGNVRLRVEYTGAVRINVDEIRISDFGEDEPEPVAAAFLSVCNGRTSRENFNSLGTAQTASLPAPWRMAGTNSLHTAITEDGAIVMGYGTAKSATTHHGGIGGSIISAGLYNFGDGPRDEAADRAAGFLSSGSNFRTCALMVPVRNVGQAQISSFRISYSVEKYKSGRSKTVELRVSDDGERWVSAGEAFVLETEADESNAVYDDELPPPVKVSAVLKRPLLPGSTIYIGWFYYSNDQNSSSAQALAIDDIAIRAGHSTVLSMQ